ncbi:MAG: dTDP-glucose 4,6 dehydratase [Methanomassiliicoccales archaeon PtaU1.Bin030]|nr:MAG: dTDP-glucose 4,6 dehydratase [Methanomassiliicoccales archaeon PtaU1.Bin030]
MSDYWTDKNVLVTGGYGFLGSHVVAALLARGVDPGNIRTYGSSELDLRDMSNCRTAVKGMDVVLHVAGRGGGIGYNQRNPGSLFYDNIIMNTHLMEAARLEGVGKFVGIGTVCSYPKYIPVPFREENLWMGYPEETNASYGLSKKMMIVQSEAYRRQYGFNSITPLLVNLYGPRDKFDLEDSHVIPALIRKFVDARRVGEKNIIVWGTGKASREFLHVRDAAEGILLAAERYDRSEPVNIGSGSEVTIKELTELIAELSGFRGEILWDESKPDGQPRRCLDTSRALQEFGYRAKVPLRDGVQETIEWYIANY